MTTVGEQLRIYRMRCAVPADPVRHLSQEYLGQLLGRELGVRHGYSGAAISDWERGSSKIHADERTVLIALIRILHRLHGIQDRGEAEALLHAGNYRALDPMEEDSIFPVSGPAEENQPSVMEAAGQPSALQAYLVRWLRRWERGQPQLEEPERGPSPAWPRRLVAFWRQYTDR